MVFVQASKGVATNGGLEVQVQIVTFLYLKYKRGIKLSNVYLHRVNDIEQHKTICPYWDRGNLFYTSMILYIKKARMRMY